MAQPTWGYGKVRGKVKGSASWFRHCGAHTQRENREGGSVLADIVRFNDYRVQALIDAETLFEFSQTLRNI